MRKLTANIHQFRSVAWPYIYFDQAFNAEEIAQIIMLCESKPLEHSELFSDSENSIQYKNNYNSIHEVNEENAGLFDKLLRITEVVNDMYFQYNLLGFEKFEYINYNPGEFYNYHTDLVHGNYKITEDTHLTKKLSAHMILSDSTEYEGGELDICESDPENHTTLEQIKGRVIFLPSYILHRTRPVKRGIKKSLVWHSVGPKFL